MTKAPAPRDIAVSKNEPRLGFNPVRAVLGLLKPSFKPSFDIKERRDLYVLRADLPGVKLQDVEVMLSDKRILISGKREEEVEHETGTENSYEKERRYGKFSRTLPLPPGVDVSQCEADLRDGVLTLELPKTSESVMKKIAVKSDKTRS